MKRSRESIARRSVTALLAMTVIAGGCGRDDADRRAQDLQETRESDAIEELELERLHDAEWQASMRLDRLEDILRQDLCNPSRPEPCDKFVEFARVVDGDTLTIDGEQVQLVGIDAPEPSECGGAQARLRLQELLRTSGFSSGNALVAAVPGEPNDGFPDRDIYGRKLRELKFVSERPPLGDELVSQPVTVRIGVELAREGLARWADYSLVNGMEVDDYREVTQPQRAAAQKARDDGRGSWTTCGW